MLGASDLSVTGVKMWKMLMVDPRTLEGEGLWKGKHVCTPCNSSGDTGWASRVALGTSAIANWEWMTRPRRV